MRTLQREKIKAWIKIFMSDSVLFFIKKINFYRSLKDEMLLIYLMLMYLLIEVI